MVRSLDQKSTSTEQVKHLYRLCSIGIAATLVNSFLLVFILRHVTSRTVLINWLSAMLLIALFQYILQQVYQSRGVMKDEATPWDRWFFVGALLSGLFWGSAAIFLFPAESIIHQFFLVLLSFGMLAGVLGAYAVFMEAFLAYGIPAVLPLIVRFILMGEGVHLTLAGTTLIVLLLLVFAAKLVNASMKTMIELRHLNFNPISPLEEGGEVSDRISKGLLKGEPDSDKNNNVEKERLRTSQWMRALEQSKRTSYNRQEEDIQKVQKSRPSRPDKQLLMASMLRDITRDINNLLTYLQGKVALILLDLDAEHPEYARLKSLERGIQRGSSLTRKLSRIGDGLEQETEDTNLNDIVIKHFHEDIEEKNRITCHLKCQEEIWDVKADQKEIERVIKRIYEDSCRDMPGGGELYVRTQNITLGDAYAKPHGLAPGKFVRVSITEIGSAAEDGRFGGSVREAEWIQDLIKKHGGILQIHREEENETTVDLYLPANENGLARRNRLEKNG